MTNAIGQEIRLAQGELRLDVPNLQVTLNGVMQTGSLKLRTKVVAGDGLALIGRIGQVKAGEIWHLLLYQVISATPEEVANYREMRDVVNWIEHGTAAEQKLVQQAVLWQERAKGTTPDKRWMKDLPGGAGGTAGRGQSGTEPLLLVDWRWEAGNAGASQGNTTSFRSRTAREPGGGLGEREPSERMVFAEGGCLVVYRPAGSGH